MQNVRAVGFSTTLKLRHLLWSTSAVTQLCNNNRPQRNTAHLTATTKWRHEMSLGEPLDNWDWSLENNTGADHGKKSTCDATRTSAWTINQNFNGKPWGKAENETDWAIPRRGGASFQGGRRVGPVGERALRWHDQREGDARLTGALTVRIGHRHWVETPTWGQREREVKKKSC